MANNWFYEKIAPDFMNPEQHGATHPGLILEVVERDAGIGIGLTPLDRDKIKDYRMCFINPDEAEEVVVALQEAIRLARKKLDGASGHPRRVRSP